MKPEQILRLIRLARRTGDTLILAGDDSSDPVVLMGVSRYEQLLDGGVDPNIEVLPEEFVVEDEPVLEVVETAGSEPVDQPPVKSAQAEKKVDAPEEDLDEERFYLEPIE